MLLRRNHSRQRGLVGAFMNGLHAAEEFTTEGLEDTEGPDAQPGPRTRATDIGSTIFGGFLHV